MAPPTNYQHHQLLNRFLNLIETAPGTWPVNGADHSQIISTFGPRIQAPTGEYDWHRGIDIVSGDPINVPNPEVVAAMSGQICIAGTSPNYPNCGNMVMIKHALPGGLLSYGSQSIDSFYTLYCHLATVEENDSVVQAGTVLGTMGSSGSAETIHLHFELRVGISSSFSYQHEHPSTPQYGYDPHMHPLLLFAPLNVPTQMRPNLVRGISDTFQYGDFNCWGKQPVLNCVEVSIQTASDTETYLLDYNRRIGFDSLQLDTPNRNVPHIDPQSFGGTISFLTRVIVPEIWLNEVQAIAGKKVSFAFKDIWGQPFDIWSALYIRDCENDVGHHPSPCQRHVSHLTLSPSKPKQQILMLRLEARIGNIPIMRTS